MKYDKLVRDRIPEIIRKNGGKPEYVVVNGERLKEYCLKKVHEELEEFSSEPCVEEAADLLEVVEKLFKEHGFSKAAIKRARAAKNEKRGAFHFNIILEEVK